MAAYLVAVGNVHDQERMMKYLEAAGPTLGPHGGELLVADDPAEVVEGNAQYSRVVVLKFPSKQNAKDWLNDPVYKTAAEHRLAASEHVLYLSDEFVMPTG